MTMAKTTTTTTKPELLVIDRMGLKDQIFEVAQRYLASSIIHGNSPNAASFTNELWKQIFVHVPKAYEHPRADDIICDRDPKANKAPGTIFARSIVSDYVEEYDRLHAENCKKSKGEMMGQIVHRIRNGKDDGLPESFDMPRVFLKKVWIPMTEDEARKRVGHWLRDHPNSSRDTKKVRKRMVMKLDQKPSGIGGGRSIHTTTTGGAPGFLGQEDEGGHTTPSFHHHPGTHRGRSHYYGTATSSAMTNPFADSPPYRPSRPDGVAMVANAAAVLETERVRRGGGGESLANGDSSHLYANQYPPSSRNNTSHNSSGRNGTRSSGQTTRTTTREDTSALASLSETALQKRIDDMVAAAIRKRTAAVSPVAGSNHHYQEDEETETTSMMGRPPQPSTSSSSDGSSDHNRDNDSFVPIQSRGQKRLARYDIASEDDGDDESIEEEQYVDQEPRVGENQTAAKDTTEPQAKRRASRPQQRQHQQHTNPLPQDDSVAPMMVPSNTTVPMVHPPAVIPPPMPPPMMAAAAAPPPFAAAAAAGMAGVPFNPYYYHAAAAAAATAAATAAQSPFVFSAANFPPARPVYHPPLPTTSRRTNNKNNVARESNGNGRNGWSR